MNKKPTIVDTEIVAESRLFKIETVSLTFSNGAERVYERLHNPKRGAVLIVPWLDDERFILIKEYAVGTDSYTLGFPKGLIDPGETAEAACNRELQEEIGYQADSLTHLKTVATAPGIMSSTIEIFEAQGLSESTLIGDEPEPIETEIISLQDISALVERPDFIEARSLAALLLIMIHRRIT